MGLQIHLDPLKHYVCHYQSALKVTTFTTPKHQNEDEDGDGDAVLHHVAVQVDDVTPL